LGFGGVDHGNTEREALIVVGQDKRAASGASRFDIDQSSHIFLFIKLSHSVCLKLFKLRFNLSFWQLGSTLLF
jgi:hypothetical protein